MRRIFKNAISLIAWDWSTLLLFEIFYKLLTLIVMTPFFQFLLRETVELAGVSFISNQTIRLILQSPHVLVLLLILLALFTFYNFIEITAIVLYFNNGIKGTRMGVFPLLWSAMKKACSIFRPRNILLLVYILVILPLTGVIISSGPLASLHIPEFIFQFIEDHLYLHIVYWIVYCLVLVLAFRWICSIHEITLRPKTSFLQACRNSVTLMHKKFLRTLLLFIIWAALIFAFITVIAAFVLTLTVLYVMLTASPESAQDVFWYYFRILLEWYFFFAAVCTSVGSLGIISAFYYQGQSQDDFVFQKPALIFTRKDRIMRPLRFFGCIFLLALYGTSFFSYQVFYNGEFAIQTSITAHRAMTETTPENTIAALQSAIDSGAKYAEIDAQLTKDGVIVIMHDTSLLRTTGVNRYVWEVTYAEIQTYDAGGWFSPAYAEEPIPTLEEMIEYARGKINLVIELKANEHNQTLTQQTVDLISRLGAESYCIIASMDERYLKTAKELAPEILTQLITAIAYGDVYDLDHVDIYSIEATFVTRSLVSNLHALGKQVFVWTINSEDTMRKMALLCVDSIVTDVPNIARETISSYSGNPLICEIVDLIFPIPA